jgi:hypothetical protein
MSTDKPDLFDYAEAYPAGPGWRDGDTSREAAEAMAGIAGTLRRVVYDYIARHPLQTADDIAIGLGKTTRAIQPRVSELRALGLIINDGRGQNPSGHAAHLWRIADDRHYQGQAGMRRA